MNEIDRIAEKLAEEGWAVRLTRSVKGHWECTLFDPLWQNRIDCRGPLALEALTRAVQDKDEK